MDKQNNPYGVAPKATTHKQVTYAPVKNNSLAITSLILGLLSIFLSLITAIPGVITGHMALSKIKKAPMDYEGKGMAITGLILSYLFLILSLLFIFAIIYMVMEIPGFKESLSEGFNEGVQQGMQH
jgi:uncharacterized BrkB/YihY/UPF0761 family membrane protein